VAVRAEATAEEARVWRRCQQNCLQVFTLCVSQPARFAVLQAVSESE
jgi:hypothetical protein